MSDLPAVKQGRLEPTRRWLGPTLTAVTLAASMGALTVSAGLAPAHAESFLSAAITVRGEPSAVAFSPDGVKAYVTNAGDNSVSLIYANQDSDYASYSIAVDHRPLDIAFSPDGTKVYVLNDNYKGWSYPGDNWVQVIEVARDRIVDHFTVGQGASGLAFSPDGATAYVTNTTDRTVSVVEVATNRVVRTVAVNFPPAGVAFSPDGTKVYLTDGGSLVWVMNVATQAITYTIKVGQGAAKVAFTPDGTKAYVTNSSSNSVSVIDVATDTVRATVAVGTDPVGVAVSPDGTTAYVTNNYMSNSVSVIDVATDAVRSTLAVGTDPLGVAVSPNGSKVFVTNSGQDSVSVIVPFVAMRVSPSVASVQAKVPVKLTTTGYSSSAQIRRNDLGPVSPVYTTDSDGVVSGSKVTFGTAGRHTITATLHGVTATAVVTVTPAPGPAPTRSPLPSASTAPTPSAGPLPVPVGIDGPTTVTPPPNGLFVITGTAPAGATVTLNFHTPAMAPQEYSLIRTVTTASDGTWRRTINANNDYRYYATVLGATSAVVLFRPAPTLDGAVARVVPARQVYPLTGTALPGSTVFLHFHKRGTAPDDFSLVRSTASDASGRWKHRYLADTDYEIYASRTAGGTSSDGRHYFFLAR